MKKKGLIVATIVMVLVLAVSLTTATYAWFTQSSTTKVDTLTLEVKSASAVAIGAKTGANNTQDDYMYDAVTLGYDGSNNNTPTYSGGQTGLGTSLSFSGTDAGTLTLTKAINTATTVTAGSAPATSDTIFNPNHTVYSASSGTTNGALDDNKVDGTSVAIAKANEDYIVLKMGAQAAQDIYGIYATVTVTTTDTATTFKMMAAMHFYIKVYDSTLVPASGDTPAHYTINTSSYKYVEFDLFGSASQNSSKSTAASLTKPAGATNIVYTYNSETKQASATFSFLIGGVSAYTAGSTKLATDGSEIFMFEIYSYIYGPDPNCISSAAGASAAFDIQFKGVATTDTTAPTNLIAVTSTY